MTAGDKRPAFESPAALAARATVDPRMRRPAATTVGAALVVLRVIAGVIWLIALSVQWNDLISDEFDAVIDADLTGDELTAAADLGLAVVLVLGGVVLLFDLVLAVFIYLGRNWARIVVMVVATLSISGSFVTWWVGDQEITLQTTLLTLSLDILIMLALSSRAARDYARRPRARRGDARAAGAEPPSIE